MANILVIAVHPDDETLGCGGTLLKYASRGDHLHWMLLTAAHPADFSLEMIKQQEHQIDDVLQAFRFDALHWLKFPMTRLETFRITDLVNTIRKVIEEIHPEIVYVPNRSDVHSDHRVAFEATQSALKPYNMRGLGVRRILACEVSGETDAASPLVENAFLPTVFVDIGRTIERKLEIFKLYESEIQPEPMPRSFSAVRAMARMRGTTIGVEYAEAFMLIREIG